MGESADLIRRCMPPPGLDRAQVVRDKKAFEATVSAISESLDPDLEAAAVWRGPGAPYRGIEGFRRMCAGDCAHRMTCLHNRTQLVMERQGSTGLHVRNRSIEGHAPRGW